MQRNKPEISIIIPSYNRANLLPRAIKSALNQTFQSFELIIVDDKSIDNTQEIISQFNDNRIKYVKHKKNKGVSAARNTGIKNAFGKYIALLDSDDQWKSKKLEKQLEIFQNSKDKKLGLVYSWIVFIDECNNEKNKIITQKKGYIFNELLKNNFIIGGGSSVLIKKDVFNNCGLFYKHRELDNTKMGCLEDYEMWIRISQKYNFDFVPDYLVNCYDNSKNKKYLSQIDNKEEANKYITNKYINFYKKNKILYSDKLRYDGIRFILGHQSKIAKKIFFKSIKINRFNIKSYIYLFFSFLGPSVCRKLNIIKMKLKHKKYT